MPGCEHTLALFFCPLRPVAPCFYRQYNPNAKAGLHNYTTSAAERDALINAGWKDEGIAWYAAGGSGTAKTAAEANQGTGGNLSIPTLGIDVALYKGSSQAIVDAEDSAAIFNSLDRRPIIADHASQSFSRLDQVTPGTTAAITKGTTVTKYTCTNIESGKNNGYDIYVDGHAVAPQTYDLMMYTCKDSAGVDVWVILWKRV